MSFAALALRARAALRHYAGANKQYSLKKSCYSLIKGDYLQIVCTGVNNDVHKFHSDRWHANALSDLLKMNVLQLFLCLVLKGRL